MHGKVPPFCANAPALVPAALGHVFRAAKCRRNRGRSVPGHCFAKCKRSSNQFILIALSVLALACLGCLPAVASASGPPTIEYLPTHPLRNHEATIHFTVDPEGLETTYEVQKGLKAGQYETDNQFMWTSELPAGNEPVAKEVKFPAY